MKIHHLITFSSYILCNKNSKYSSGFLSLIIKIVSILVVSFPLIVLKLLHASWCFMLHASCVMVIIEGDADVIIKAINSGGFSSSSFGHISKDIKLLSSAFHKVSYSHTCRQGNRVAHRLARMACNFSSFQVWMEDVPPDVASVYLSDLPK